MIVNSWKKQYRAQNEAVDGVMAGFWGKCF